MRRDARSITNPFACLGSSGPPSSAYPASHPKPKAPPDLTDRRCIFGTGAGASAYRWAFEKGRKSLAVAVNGPLVVDDVDVLIQAAVDGTGLAFTLEDHVKAQLDAGALVRVLDDWYPPFTGCFL